MESPAIPITDANRLTGRFLMEGLFRTGCELEIESVNTAYSPDSWIRGVAAQSSQLRNLEWFAASLVEEVLQMLSTFTYEDNLA